MVLVATLDFPNRLWDLAPWQKLTQVMRHFYMAWLSAQWLPKGPEERWGESCPAPGILGGPRPGHAMDAGRKQGSRWRVKVLYKSVMVLVATLDFPNRVWDLAPWQKLTQVMRHFYMAWLRCWSCWSCRSTRSRIHRLAGTIVPLWRHYVWRDPPSTLPLHKARVLFHHVFAAFIFGYSEDYMKQCLAVLQASGHLRLLEELISLMNFRGPSLKNFTWSAEKNRRRLESISLKSLSQAVSKTVKGGNARIQADSSFTKSYEDTELETEGEWSELESEGKVECTEDKVECSEGKVECSENKVECTEDEVECSENKVECSEDEVECSEDKVECSEDKVECSEDKIECSEDEVECSEDKVECSEDKIECSEDEVECSEDKTESLRLTPLKGTSNGSDLNEESKILPTTTYPQTSLHQRRPTSLTTQQPASPTHQPASPTQPTSLTTHQPASPTNTNPHPPTNQPHPPTNQPHPLNNQPHPPTNQPHPPTHQPHPPTNQPHPPTNQPHPPTNQPHPPTNQPHPPTNQPHPPTNYPQQHSDETGGKQRGSAFASTGQDWDSDGDLTQDSDVVLTAGQREGEWPMTSLDPQPGQCGFFLTQDKESEELLLPLVSEHLQSGSENTAHVNIHEISLCDVSVGDLEDIDCTLLTRLTDQDISDTKEGHELAEIPDCLKESSPYESPRKVEMQNTEHFEKLASEDGMRTQKKKSASEDGMRTQKKKSGKLKQKKTKVEIQNAENLEEKTVSEDGMRTQKKKSGKSKKKKTTKVELESAENFEEKTPGSEIRSLSHESQHPEQISPPQKAKKRSSLLPQSPKKGLQATSHTKELTSSAATQEEYTTESNDVKGSQSPSSENTPMNPVLAEKSGLHSPPLAESGGESEAMRILMRGQGVWASGQDSGVCEAAREVDDGGVAQTSDSVLKEDEDFTCGQNNTNAKESLMASEDGMQSQKKKSGKSKQKKTAKDEIQNAETLEEKTVSEDGMQSQKKSALSEVLCNTPISTSLAASQTPEVLPEAHTAPFPASGFS
ncbi:Aspartic and glutamic acid-rich protein [Chionoecetes opilio]|uniref:Aspartic and glutamic acid-rich protein n=1 Tax=Chionoecetes opilio TaxID=41210 RepID=A0A8J5C5R0_CHIOP|nr:Aspartic and glutamic acid-rich protein [Chionoecetes opilio]